MLENKTNTIGEKLLPGYPYPDRSTTRTAPSRAHKRELRAFLVEPWRDPKVTAQILAPAFTFTNTLQSRKQGRCYAM